MALYERSGALMERKFREYLVPTILASISIVVATAISTIIVGNLLGENALAAIELAGPIIYGFNAVAMLFAIGGVICASTAKGRRETDHVNRIFTLTFATGIITTLVLFAALFLFMGPIIYAVTQGDIVLAELTRAFLIPFAFAGPLMVPLLCMGLFARLDGKPYLTVYIAIVMNVVNCASTFAFIQYMGMGIAGAGLGFVLGCIAGLFVLVPYMRSKQRTLHFIKPQAGDFTHVLQITSVGSPNALFLVLAALRVLVLNALIMGTLGSLGVATMAVCANAIMLAGMFISGTDDTLLPIVGTLYGEKDYSGIRFTMRTGFTFMIIACVTVMAVLLIIPGEVGRLFGMESPEGLAMVESALLMYALSLPLSGVNSLLQSLYQTTERVKLSSLSVLLNEFVFVTFFALLFVGWNANFIWLAFLLGEIATFLVVLGIGMHIRKKESVRGMLLLPKKAEDEVLLDLSIPATVEAATGISEQVIQFCRENNTGESMAMRMGIAVEEMTVNTAHYGHKNKKGVIDVLVRITEQELILRLRDDGIPFDPTEYQPEEEHEFVTAGIEMVRRLSKDIKYAWQIGFNVSIITIPRTSLRKN